MTEKAILKINVQTNGPAAKSPDGFKTWYQNVQTDGPATEYSND